MFLSFCFLDDFFSFSKKIGFRLFLVHPTVVSSIRLTVFLPPLPEVGCQIFLEIQNPWGKVMERSGLTLEHFSLEVV